MKGNGEEEEVNKANVEEIVEGNSGGKEGREKNKEGVGVEDVNDEICMSH